MAQLDPDWSPASFVGQLEIQDPTPEALCRRMAAELEANLLRALEMGVQKAASVFEKSADAQIIPRGQYVSEGEAANLSSLTSWGLSLHVGFHSHIEIISHLLHLCVQMALFPRPEQTETSVQANSRSVFSSHQGVQVGSNGRPRDRAVQHPSRNYQVPGWRPVVDASTETRPKGGPPAWRRSIKDSQIKRPRNAIVRIGGGWHVLRNDPEPSEKTESAAGTALAVRTSSPASSPSRSRSPDPERHPFAHGAPSRDTPIERFTFGAYASGSSFGHTYASKDPEKVAREVDRGKLRHYGLFRVLKPREPLDSPTLALSNGSNGGGTPRSLRTPSPSPRRRAESSELVDVEEVDEDEEIPGITVFAPNAMQVPTHTRPVRPRARPSSAPRDFQRGSPMEPGQLPQRPSSASSIQRRY